MNRQYCKWNFLLYLECLVLKLTGPFEGYFSLEYPTSCRILSGYLIKLIKE